MMSYQLKKSMVIDAAEPTVHDVEMAMRYEGQATVMMRMN